MSDLKKSKKKTDEANKTFYSTLSSKNQITVPSVIREKLNAEPGDQVAFSYDEEIEEITVSNIKKDALLTLYGSMPPRGEADAKNWDSIRQTARDELFELKDKDY